MTTALRLLLGLAHLALAGVGIVILYDVNGLGLVCPGGPLAALIVVAVVGVRRALKAHDPAQRSAASLSVLALCLAAWIANDYDATRPLALFRRCVADPCPASVRIIDARYEGGLDDAVYLHFSISPEDFPELLQTRSYEELEGDKADPSRTIAAGIGPPWWRPEKLANPSAYKLHIEGQAVEMWTNGDRTEVFFALWHL